MLPNDRLTTTKMGGSKPAPTNATPRLSASLLLLNEKNEVLMIQRTTDSRTFAGMHVSGSDLVCRIEPCSDSDIVLSTS